MLFQIHIKVYVLPSSRFSADLMYFLSVTQTCEYYLVSNPGMTLKSENIQIHIKLIQMHLEERIPIGEVWEPGIKVGEWHLWNIMHNIN